MPNTGKREMRGFYVLSTLYPLHKTSGLFKAKPATVHDLHCYLQHVTTDTQLMGLSPLCASELMDRDSIKLRFKLLFFRYAEHGHFLYFSNIRADHGHSEKLFWHRCPWEKRKGKEEYFKEKSSGSCTNICKRKNKGKL